MGHGVVVDAGLGTRMTVFIPGDYPTRSDQCRIGPSKRRIRESGHDAATGSATWPASAGVHSPGTERWILVTSKGAWLLDAAGTKVAVPSTVDVRSRSFIVRVPRALLRPSGRWRVRLASGLANAAGDALAPVGPDRGALAGQPAVYNVAFRSNAQEPVAGENWWRDEGPKATVARPATTERPTPSDALAGCPASSSRVGRDELGVVRAALPSARQLLDWVGGSGAMDRSESGRRGARSRCSAGVAVLRAAAAAGTAGWLVTGVRQGHAAGVERGLVAGDPTLGAYLFADRDRAALRRRPGAGVAGAVLQVHDAGEPVVVGEGHRVTVDRGHDAAQVGQVLVDVGGHPATLGGRVHPHPVTGAQVAELQRRFGTAADRGDA